VAARGVGAAGCDVGRRLPKLSRAGGFPCIPSPLFAKHLAEAGFVEGQNIVVDYRWAGGQYDLLPSMAADLVRREVTVIARLTATFRRWRPRRQPQRSQRLRHQ
jgi:hypothetical protein